MHVSIHINGRTLVIPDWLIVPPVIVWFVLSLMWDDTTKIYNPNPVICCSASVEESESEKEFLAEEQIMSFTDDVQVDEKCFIYDDEDDNDDHYHEEDENNEGEDHAVSDDYQE